MDTNLVLEGSKFMVLGMGTVFLFLVLMIASINLMSAIIHKFFPEPEAAPIAPSSSKSNTNAKIAAATAAIMQHRKK